MRQSFYEAVRLLTYVWGRTIFRKILPMTDCRPSPFPLLEDWPVTPAKAWATVLILSYHSTSFLPPSAG